MNFCAWKKATVTRTGSVSSISLSRGPPAPLTLYRLPLDRVPVRFLRLGPAGRPVVTFDPPVDAGVRPRAPATAALPLTCLQKQANKSKQRQPSRRHGNPDGLVLPPGPHGSDGSRHVQPRGRTVSRDRYGKLPREFNVLH